jgi:hypothetical protein
MSQNHDEELWQLLCRILRNHMKPGHSCEDTLNRLWTKNVTELRPRIRETGATLSVETWDFEKLWALIPDADVTDQKPKSKVDPLIVVRWQNRDYRIDGRRRINEWKRRGENGPHTVLVIEIDA